METLKFQAQRHALISTKYVVTLSVAVLRSEVLKVYLLYTRKRLNLPKAANFMIGS